MVQLSLQLWWYFFLIIIEEDMDGKAINMAFAAQSGPDCLLHVVKKYGLRLKVYKFFWDILNSDLEVNARLRWCTNQIQHHTFNYVVYIITYYILF